MTERTITCFYFVPFADGREQVGLRFPFDQLLIDELKRLGRVLRPQVTPHSAVGWLPYRAWFCDPRVWSQVALALVRRDLWQQLTFRTSAADSELVNLPAACLTAPPTRSPTPTAGLKSS
jgi:hypothetical protein